MCLRSSIHWFIHWTVPELVWKRTETTSSAVSRYRCLVRTWVWLLYSHLPKRSTTYMDIDTRPLTGRFLTSLVYWNLLIITLMVEMGISTALAFLAATFYFVKLNNLVLHIRTIFLGFTPCDGWLREFDLCVPRIYNPVEQEVMAGQFHAPCYPGVLKM